MGFIEADLIFPMGTHVFMTEALLLVLPTTEYQKRVPVTIGTSLTDMAVDSLGLSDTLNYPHHGDLFVLLLKQEDKFRPNKFRNKLLKLLNLQPCHLFPQLLHMDILN